MNAIVWCVDENEKYNAMALHSIFSAREHDNSSDFFVMTLKSNIYANLYRQINRLTVIYVDDEYEMYFKGRSVDVNDVVASSFAYCRFLVFKLDVFKKYEKTLYLDCDTSVKKRLDCIFNIQLCDNNAKIMLIPECLPSNYNLNLLKSFCHKNNFIYDSNCYGNSGVMLVMQKNIADIDFFNIVKLIKFNFPIHDQGILNFYFQDKIQFIDAKFNVFHESDPNNEVGDDIVIRQYAGKEKNDIVADSRLSNKILLNVLNKIQKNKEDFLINDV